MYIALLEIVIKEVAYCKDRHAAFAACLFM